MTGEEAIKTLESAKHFAYDGIYEEAFDTAIKALEQKSTAKNDLAGNIMDFPNTFDEFVKDYGFRDKQEIYTNGSELIPVFRVKQWLEHILTTKNDLGVDWESYKDADGNSLDYLILNVLQNNFDCGDAYGYTVADKIIDLLPSVTPQEPRWIPVSERLPDTDDEVLCWYEYYHWSREKVLPEYGLGSYLKETSSWFGEVANGHKVRVIAWMPLPKAYREVEE